MMCQFYHLLVSSWCIQLLSCIIIHRMNTGQPDLTICSNPHYDKTAYSLKPHVQIKAILYRSPGRSQIESTGRAKVTADTTDVYKKIIIIIKFMNRGKTSTDEEYIVVDHVTDQRTKTSYRLLDPLVFKAKQDQIKQMYPLKKVRLVNWDPWEEVINKNNKHYQGCNTDVTHATCGVQYDANNKTIEYSEGFCCSCDAYVNMYRQPADFSQDFIHLPVDTAASDQRNKRDVVEGIAENLINVWRGQVIADFTTHYATDSRLSQIRTKKEIGKFLLEKATRALENIKQFSNVHFDSAKPPQPNRSSIKLTRCQSFPNYITIPGLETAYGFTSNDTTRLNAMVDPWDLPLSHVTSSSHSKNDQLKNQHFFHVLGEIQTGNLNASYESNIADKSIQCKANTLSECNKTQYKRSVTTNVVITSCPANNKTNTNSISQVDYICLVNRVYTETVTAESNTIEYKGMNILSNSVTSQSGTSNTLDTMTSTKESITTAKQNLNVPLCIKKNIFVNVSNNIESSKENLDIKKSKSYVQGTIEHHTSTNTPNPMMVSTWENFPAPKSNHNHIECSTIENINPNPNITSLIVATEFQNISTLEPTNINNLTENIVDHKPNETVNIIVTNTPNNSMLSSRKIYVNTRISNNDDNMKSVPSEIWQNISKFTQTEAANIVNKMPPNVMQNISMSNLINTQDIMLNNNLPSTVKENMTKEKNNIVISTAAKKGLTEHPPLSLTSSSSEIKFSTSKLMYGLYGINNISQFDLISMKHHFPEIFYNDSFTTTNMYVEKPYDNKTSTFRKLKFRIKKRVKCNKNVNNTTQNLLKILKPKKYNKTKEIIRTMKDSPKTKTGNILNRIDSKICHRSSKSNNSSTKQRDTNLFISITDKNHVRYEKYEKMKSLDVQAKAKATKQYSCQHVISDRYNPDGKLLLESVCKNKEALELGSIDYSPMKTSQVNHSIEKGSNKVNSNGGSLHQLETRLIDDKKLIDSKVQEHVNNDKIDLSLWNNNNLQLNQDVMNTLLDLIQDESLIQIYNAMNLRGNRCLLEQEVEKLEKKVARSFFRHVKHSANTSGEVIKKIVKRQITSSGVQVRGGQSCVDRIVPSYVTDPDTYHESAHCLRFSDIWYTLYKLNSPVIEHSLEVNIFEKHYVDEHVGHWSQLSKGMPTKLSTTIRHVSNVDSKCPKCPSISINYLPLENPKKGPFCLNPESVYLLTPQHKCSQCSNIQGGPKEYMLVPPDDVTLEGDTCNKIGVSYKAFATQPSRCSKLRGTCLDGQISDLWHQDKKAKLSKTEGKYFLENFASVSDDAHCVNESTGEEYLALEYTGSYSSAVEIEIDNHFHTVVKVGESGSIAEVHIDATCKLHTKIGVLVTNYGLTCAIFSVNLTNCPVELASICAKLETSPVTIYPQQRHVFRFTLNEDLPLERFTCSVVLINNREHQIASRKIRVQKSDRCFCIYHCSCACTGSTNGLQCCPLTLNKHQEAGFMGSLPEDSVSRSDECLNLLSAVFVAPNSNPWIHLVVYLTVVFLLMGLAKAIVGLCCLDYVCNYGMWMLISSRATEMTKYKETELEDEEFIRDEMGYPVHPKYLTRSIRYVSQHKQFILNVLFYILLLLVVTKKVLCHYLHLMWDLLCCCCKPVTGLTAKTRIRGGEDVEADDFIRNANREVLEVRDVLHNSMYKFFSGREDNDSLVSCAAMYSDVGLDNHRSDKTWIQIDVLSEPSRKSGYREDKDWCL